MMHTYFLTGNGETSINEVPASVFEKQEASVVSDPPPAVPENSTIPATNEKSSEPEIVETSAKSTVSGNNGTSVTNKTSAPSVTPVTNEKPTEPAKSNGELTIVSPVIAEQKSVVETPKLSTDSGVVVEPVSREKEGTGNLAKVSGVSKIIVKTQMSVHSPGSSVASLKTSNEKSGDNFEIKSKACRIL